MKPTEHVSSVHSAAMNLYISANFQILLGSGQVMETTAT